MGAAGPWETFFWYASVLVKAGLLARLAWLRVAGEYPALSVFLLLQLVRTLGLLPHSTDSNEYSFTWVLTEPVLILSRAVVVFELYGKILASYRGLSFVSRGTMAAVLAVSLTVSLVLHAGDFTPRGDLSAAMKVVHLTESTVYSALLLYLLILVAFMLWFRAPVRRNLLIHCWGFSLYFLVSSAMVYVRGLGVDEWGRISSAWRMAAANLIMAAWIILITKDGERPPSGPSGDLPADGKRRLLQQLEEINLALERKQR